MPESIGFRPSTAADLDLVTGIALDEGVGSIGAERYLDELRQGRYRHEWTWLVEVDGQVVGRAAWWGQASSSYPVALDCLQVDATVAEREAVATGLLLAGMDNLAEANAPTTPHYNLSVANTWREDPEVVVAVAWRLAAARAAGLTDEVERLRFEWSPPDGLPSGGNRLVYSEAGDAEVLDAFRRVAVGSLDHETNRQVATIGPEEAARDEIDFYLSCPGERSWWRLARTSEGLLAGLVVPSATPYNRNVGYLGVVPELRGQNLISDLLAWVTRFHAADGSEVITATTDTTNAPMAAAFSRAGYRTTQRRLIWSAPPT